jgi:superfamily II DNA or RNA helicase
MTALSDTRTASCWTPGQRVVSRGRQWTLLDIQPGESCAALRLSGDLDPGTSTLISPFDRIQGAPEPSGPAVVRPDRLACEVRRLAAHLHPAGALRAAAASAMRLMPYQLEPALAVVRQGATRLLIADEVGLGKTIQAGLIAAELSARKPSLRAVILVPAGLRDQWQLELARLFGLPCTLADSAWLKEAAADRPAAVNPWALPGIYLASHDFVKRPEVLRPLEEVSWDLFVMDEAHAASARTDRRAAAHAVASRAACVVLLTATPPAESPQEYEALCAIGRFAPEGEPILLYRRTRLDVGAGAPRRSTLLAVRPTESELRMHQLLEDYTRRIWQEASHRQDDLARLAAIILRKRALSSAASLAASVRRRMALLVTPARPEAEQLQLPLGDEDPLADGEETAALGAPGMADASREQRWLALIAEAAARAALHESKIRYLRRLIRRVREPVIVFTEYRDTLERLRRALAKSADPLLVLHGGLSPIERSRVQREFNGASTPGRASAVLLATDAAAEGLNLHARCRTVLHFELPWSTTRLEQRAGRVDRFGQTHRVHEGALVAAATAERLVLAPLMRRAARVRATPVGTGGMPVTLTESHVAELIIGGAFHPPQSPSAQAADFVLLADGRELAESECQRLERLRAFAGASPPALTPAAVRRPIASVLRRRRSDLKRGLVLVYRLSLSYFVERPFHEEPVVIALPTVPAVPRPLRTRDIRNLAAPFTNAAHPAVLQLLSNSVVRALDTAVPVHTQVSEALARRAVAMRRVSPSAARQLVQGGLFDRRRYRTAAPKNDETPPAQASASPPAAVDVRLAAALLVL